MSETVLETVFDAYEVGGDPSEVIRQALEGVGLPLTEAEQAQLQAEHRRILPDGPALEFSAWHLPSRPLPASLESLLTWSRGGWARSGAREFGFFGADLREMLLAYQVPLYLPEALPFAFNGGGVFYLLDLRRPAVNGEYPVLAAHSGVLEWERAVPVGRTLLEACGGRENVEDLLYPEDQG